MATPTIARLREDYAGLSRLADTQDTSTLDALRTSNAELREAVDGFKQKLEGGLTELPNHQKILTPEYELLQELARINGASEERVLEGVKEVENGRVTRLELDDLGLRDTSPLAGLAKLQVVSLLGNQLTDISALSGLTGLQELWLGWNQLTDMSTLSGLTGLQKLGLNNNQLTDISALSGLTRLQRLGLYNNQLTDISALSALANLSYLDIEDNPLSAGAKQVLSALRKRNVEVIAPEGF